MTWWSSPPDRDRQLLLIDQRALSTQNGPAPVWSRVAAHADAVHVSFTVDRWHGHDGCVRALEPDRLMALSCGLWAVDAFQPVAAVLDAHTGGVRGVVSWAQLPPGPAGEVWPPSRVLGDGTSLWVQHHAGGPLARVDAGGVQAVVWTDGLWLAATGPGVAWCSPGPPEQVLVHGAGAGPVSGLHHDRLLRVDAAGRATTVRTDAPVRWVQAGDGGLLIQVDVDPWHLHDLGASTFEVVRATRWLFLPWESPLPQMVTVGTHGLGEGEEPTARVDADQRRRSSWHAPGQSPDPYTGSTPSTTAGGLGWHLGWSEDPVRDESGLWRTVTATAHDQSGNLLQRHDLGRGTVLGTSGIGERVVAAVARAPWRPRRAHAPVDIVAIDPRAGQVEVLAPGDSIDITAHCWPMPARAVDADSYTHQVLAANQDIDTYWHGEAGVQPLAAGVSDGRAELVGDWPDTQLQWTFTFAPYPGLRLRRRVRLFDELGRPIHPEHAAIHLMEDLDTFALPPASAASNGILDI